MKSSCFVLQSRLSVIEGHGGVGNAQTAYRVHVDLSSHQFVLGMAETGKS